MRGRIARIPFAVTALAAIGLGIASGVAAANAAGVWVRIVRYGSGPICAQQPCPTPTIVVGPAEFAEFRPNADFGLAIGVGVAVLLVGVWLWSRRAPSSRAEVSR